MLQRIQTIYLAGSLLLVALLLNLPLITLTDAAGKLYTLTVSGLAEENGTQVVRGIYAAIMYGLIGLLILVSIFMYSRRPLQMRIVLISLLLFIGSYGMVYYSYILISSKVAISLASMHIALVFPLIGAILQFLAYKGISRDDKLVKSYDRLR